MLFDQLRQFTSHNWALVLALLIVLILLIREEMKSKSGGGGRISPQVGVQLINRENATVFDIRNPEEFQQGHIIGSENLPKATFDINDTKLAKFKTKTIILVESTGVASASLVQNLRKAGFEKAYAIHGGINEWKKANLPLTKVQGDEIG